MLPEALVEPVPAVLPLSADVVPPSEPVTSEPEFPVPELWTPDSVSRFSVVSLVPALEPLMSDEPLVPLLLPETLDASFRQVSVTFSPPRTSRSDATALPSTGNVTFLLAPEVDR